MNEVTTIDGVEETPKKVSGLMVFDTDSLMDTEHLDADGLILTLPESIDILAYKPIKADKFSGKAFHLDYRAVVADAHAAQKTSLAGKLREKAATLRKFGNDKDRKRAERLIAMKAAFAKLAAELEADGVDVGDIGGINDSEA